MSGQGARRESESKLSRDEQTILLRLRYKLRMILNYLTDVTYSREREACCITVTLNGGSTVTSAVKETASQQGDWPAKAIVQCISNEERPEWPDPWTE